MSKTYEAMFILDPALATDLPAAEVEIGRILDRAGAKPLGTKVWDDRKLAYPIGPHKRGLYFLSFFETSPDKIGGLERDVRLSEQMIRVLVLRRDRMTPEDIEKAFADAPAVKGPSRPSDRDDRDRDSRDYRDRDRDRDRGRDDDRGRGRGDDRPHRDRAAPASEGGAATATVEKATDDDAGND